MVSYNMVKFCIGCKSRFVVSNSFAKRVFCDACEKQTARKVTPKAPAKKKKKTKK